jgi:hypothetical protein
MEPMLKAQGAILNAEEVALRDSGRRGSLDIW